MKTGRNIILGIVLLFIACACSSEEDVKRVAIDTVQPTDTVWICTGSGATRFHSNEKCEGMLKCTKAIKQVTRAEAEAKRRTYCQKCYR
ncbi:MAG: hypothetical protein IJK93_02520 [Muribaculaceae bacterium]|nr:hypothetical protein [Muribaculaceae bacterium]